MADREYKIAIIVTATSKAGEVLEGLGANVQSLGKVALGLGGAAVAGVGAMGAALAKLAVDAAPIAGIEEAFIGVAESSGESADAMLAALEKGSAGMIAQSDLMTSYNKAAQLVGTTFANQLPDAMESLGKVASATGEDMGFMLDSLVTGVGRLSPMILDNLGVQVDLTAAYETWAETAGVAATKVIDNTEAIEKERDAVAKIEGQLQLAAIRQSEWTEKTKESTKVAHATKVDELTKKLAEHSTELAGLEANQGKVVESTEDLAASMTKGQQQAALMAQVLELLGENTAAMPEVTGSAAQQLAEMGAKFQNVKDDIGKAFLPVLSELMGMLLDLADRIIPYIVPAMETLADVVMAFLSGAPGDFPWEDIFPSWLADVMYQISDIFETIISVFSEWGDYLGFISERMADFGLAGLNLEVVLRSLLSIFLEQIGVSDEMLFKFFDIINVADDLISRVAGWITEFVSWKDVWVALGIAVASVVIPALISLVASIAPVIAAGAALVGIIALVRTAWEENWLGIQEIVGSVGSYITETVWPAIQTVFNVLKDEVLPAAQTAFETLWTRAEEAWSRFWNAFQPTLERMYEKLKEFWAEIKPKLEEAWSALQSLWDTVVTMFKDRLQPAIDLLAEALGISSGETGEWAEKLGVLAGVLLEAGLETILNSIVVAIEAFVVAVKAVTVVMDAWNLLISGIKSGLEGLELPDWLTPGSPTPLQLGIEGINEALSEMGRLLPDLRMEGTLGLALGGGQGRGGERVVVLAPIFLDPREYVSAGGGIDYQRVTSRLRELQQGI